MFLKIKSFFLQKPRNVRIFLYAFGITLLATIIIGTILWFTMRNWIQPPDIPDQVVITRPVLESPIDEEDNEGAVLDPEDQTDVEDEPVVGTPPPEVIAIMDRKDLFFTFLVFGHDQGGRTDTLMIGAFDAINHSAYVINVPRDTRINVNRSVPRIVQAYPIGRSGGRGHDGGVAQLKNEMQSLFGFPVDFYISIDMNAFADLVDAIGGVQITVPFNMVYDDPYQNLHINLQQGTWKLNGEQALQFARFRYHNNRAMSITDYRRIEHQQMLIRAIANELLSPATLLRVPELIGIYRDNVRTDLTYGQMTWFAMQLPSFGGIDSLSTYTLPTLGGSNEPGGGEIPDQAAILELINRTVNPFIEPITAEMVNMVSR